MRCVPIGILNMSDSGEIDEKIIAVCVNDPDYNQYKDISELPPHILEEISHFFMRYKELEHGKETSIEGYQGRDKAIEAIAAAKLRYEKVFPYRP